MLWSSQILSLNLSVQELKTGARIEYYWEFDSHVLLCTYEMVACR